MAAATLDPNSRCRSSSTAASPLEGGRRPDLTIDCDDGSTSSSDSCAGDRSHRRPRRRPRCRRPRRGSQRPRARGQRFTAPAAAGRAHGSGSPRAACTARPATSATSARRTGEIRLRKA
ncbi:unnamed protein product, partial [Prorocentrum cordatum]